MSNKISRRDFFRFISWFTIIPFVTTAGLSIFRHLKISQKKEVRISANHISEITFHEEVIITKNNSIEVYSSRCPHLGCRISSIVDNQLICPCHGSRFDFTGINMKGPASKPLEKLKFTEEPSTGEIIIRV